MTDGVAEHVGPAKVFSNVLSTLRSHPVEAVFAPGYWPVTSLAVLAAARCAGRRVVMMSASHDGAGSHSRWKTAVKRFLVRRFDAALVGGSRHVDHFVELGLPRDVVFPGYDVVDNEYFAEAAARAREQSDALRTEFRLPRRYFLTLGRLVGKKNLHVLVDAFATVRARHPSCPSLVFVGSGPEERSLIVRAESRGLKISRRQAPIPDADVFFHPFAQIDATPVFYGLADVFVLPSTVEEWGLVVNEAMAAGLPIIASSAAGCCRDLVHHGVNGFVFDPQSADELASYMDKFVVDPGLSARMGAQSSALIARWGPDWFAANALRAATGTQPSNAAVVHETTH